MTPFRCAATALAVLVLLSILSRTAASESTLGVFGLDQLRRSANRLLADARRRHQACRQDRGLVEALRDNLEAAACCRAAQLVLQQAGLRQSSELLDLMADVQEEAEYLNAELAEYSELTRSGA